VAGHLTSFLGCDTLPAIQLLKQEYGASYDEIAFSVAATEHSVMTALGRDGEFAQVSRALDGTPEGILSVVADSYDIYEFVDRVGTQFKDRILARDGVFVVRPDSITQQHPRPDLLVTELLERLWKYYGGTKTSNNFRVLDPHVRVLWGDGIDPKGIEHIVNRAMLNGFSPSNLVFGMGGGLVQKVNRDTERFAFKCSAQKRDGEWHDVSKTPLDRSKASKAGRLRLCLRESGEYVTLRENEVPAFDQRKTDVLRTVFEDGCAVNTTTLQEVRARVLAS
jgi:nicotinamide phosphoribosyltransferase